jgi:hypothetical protein
MTCDTDGIFGFFGSGFGLVASFTHLLHLDVTGLLWSLVVFGRSRYKGTRGFAAISFWKYI